MTLGKAYEKYGGAIMDFKKKQILTLSLMLSTLISNVHGTQQSVVRHHLGRDVDSSTAQVLASNPAKILEYRDQVQKLSDMSPEAYVATREKKPLAPVSEIVSTHEAHKELSRLNVTIPSSEHEEAASHLVSLGRKGFDDAHLYSVIELQTDADKKGFVDKQPSPSRIAAMAFFKKVSHKPSERELDVMAYIVNPDDVKISEPKPEEFQAALYLMDLTTPVVTNPTGNEIRAAAFLRAGVINNPSAPEVRAAAYLQDGVISKPTDTEVRATEALMAGPILKPNVDEVKAAEELIGIRVVPTVATVKAMMYFKLPKIRIAKPSPEIVKAAAYLLDPEKPVIKEPTPEYILAAEVLFEQVKMTNPTAADVKAMDFFMAKGIMPAPTEFEVKAGAYLIFGSPVIIANPKVEEIKATAYLLQTYPTDSISKPSADQVRATVYLQTTAWGMGGPGLRGVIASKPTPDQVNATVYLMTSQFGAKPYPKIYLAEIDAVLKGTTPSQKSLIAWFIQNSVGNIPGGIGEVLKSERGYQYFRFVPVAFDVMASKVAPCIFEAGKHGSPGTDGFRVFETDYPTGLKDGDQFVFESLAFDKLRPEAVSISKIAKPL